MPITDEDIRAVGWVGREGATEEAGAFVARALAIPRSLRLWAVHLYADQLGPRLGEVLADLWNDSEGPSSYGTVGLVRLFQKAGFVSDQPGIERPTEPMTIWRGIPADATPRGMSWTTDEKARWFAQRTPLITGRWPGEVWRATILPAGVLAILHSRKESEVVVNPRRLRALERVAVVERPADLDKR